MAKIRELANKLANDTDSDIFFYNGDIERPYDDQLLDLCQGSVLRKNVILFLCTRGGDPDAAYRIARCLQECYSRFSVVIAGKCKSSGTLIAVGATEIVMTSHAELGPLDIQLGKKDELFETDSGLTVLNALSELETKAFELFENGFMKLKIKSQGRITLKTATSLANDLAIGLMVPIMSQIDPLHVGQVSRAMKIGKEYGERLSAVSKNLQEKALDTLVNDYPSHGFVIDKKEAGEIFNRVRDANEIEIELIQLFGGAVRSPSPREPILFNVSDWKTEVQHDNNQQQDNSQEQAEGAGDIGADTGNVETIQPAPEANVTSINQKSGGGEA